MAITMEELKERVERLETDVLSLRQLLEEHQRRTDGLPPIRRREWLPGVWVIDPESARPHIDRAFQQMGIDITQSAPPAEEVQALMLREGVDPDECLISRGIIEAREE